MPENQKLVSVIIPTYNRDRFINEAIQSVLNQSYKNFEILIVDDGSQDRTREVVSGFKDGRINYYFQTNQGRSSARNLALFHAVGEYITFLDSDDVYLPDKLAKQVMFLEQNQEFAMVYSSASCIDENGALLGHSYIALESGKIYKQIAYFVPNTIILPTVMVRTEVLLTVGEFDKNLHRFEDTDMWRRISKKYMIYAMHDTTCLIRTHQDNSLRNQKPEDIIKNLDYYVNKVIAEDIEFSIKCHREGFSKLYQYYAEAFYSVPEFRDYVRIMNYKANTKYYYSLLRQIINFIKNKLGNVFWG